MNAHPAFIDLAAEAAPDAPDRRENLAIWTSDEIAAATGGVASRAFSVSGVAYDSREIVGGDLFVALQGESADGHRFVAGAYAQGASAALVSQPVDGPHVLVADTTRALDALGAAARARAEALNDAKIIGVTGSAGKTGTKEALFAALDRASHGQAHRSVKSYNNHVGVPLSLARMSAQARFGVFEMGMNHAGELAALTRLVRPHIAIVTTIAPAHIGYFGSEAAIADAKGEIFEGLEPGGVAIIPADSPHYARLRAKAEQHAAQIITFGRAADADARVLDHVNAMGGGSLITAQLGDRRLCYTVASPGEHWIMNSLAVLAAVQAAGGNLGAAGLALAEMEGLAGRGARHRLALADGGEALLIDESYNANPASMRATIAQLGEEPAAKRRIVVLGAMKELGEEEARYHAELAGPICAASVDVALLVGDEMAALADQLVDSRRPALAVPATVAHVANATQARSWLRTAGLQPGDALLVKGSNATGLGQLVRALIDGEV